ncbi:MAG: T9SS type A sorting domain-containing protein [Bacteroidota bacterium]
MKKFPLFILFIFLLGSLSAQSFVNAIDRNNGGIAAYSGNRLIKILAVMVEFQEDKYDGTTGNGKFGSHFTKAYGDTILDPLPHNADYFEDHLEFAKNYFNKVSKGKVQVEYKVLPQVITVSKMMREYVPAFNSNNNTPLGNFAKEVWQLADQKFTNIRFADYDLFIIFHAGISNAFSYGAPLINRNMPSLYLSKSAFKKIFGNQFNGIAVNNNSFLIDNTIIMPETESREAAAIDGSLVLAELSINGLLVSNIASHIGLPDLFNTSTGKSAIGRFGLMDPQSIFANSGMFPPEPSPWEKIYLGWESPVTLNPGNRKVTIAARNIASQNDTTLLKIPINSTEYFLVENRAQDSNNDKVKVTYKRSGQIYTKVIELDTSGVYVIERRFKNGIEGGVVIDVDEFDAGLPGSGIVIWHIDEKVINEKIIDNKINADFDRKGVDVEEADGIQDIGETFVSPIDEIIGEGSKEDFWFKENKARLYKNRFSYNSKPNSRSNDGTNSLITLENFSPLANKISFDLVFGSNEITLNRSVKLPHLKNLFSISSLQIGNSFWTYLLDGTDLVRADAYSGNYSAIKNFSSFKPAAFKDGANEFVIGANGKKLSIISTINNVYKLTEYLFTADITAAPVIVKSGGVIKGLIGTSDGKVYRVDVLESISSNLIKGIVALTTDNKPVKQIASYEDYFSIITDNSFTDSNGKTLILNQKLKRIALTKNIDGKFVNVILAEGNYFYIVIDGQLTSSFSIPVNEISSFSLADLFADGNNYILFNAKSKIYAVNFLGVSANNFPFETESVYSLISSPLVIDLNNDGNSEVLSFNSKGGLYAVTAASGKLLNPYPVNVINNTNIIPVIILEELPAMGPIAKFKPVLPALNDTGILAFWSLSNLSGKEYWINEFAGSSNSSYVSAADSKSKTADYFPPEKAYNWPNPVYGNETNIRYFVAEDSEVSIKIFDLSGDLVANLISKATGGIDNEVRWNVSGIQSGVYYARIEAKSSTGKRANKLIKIAVIK